MSLTATTKAREAAMYGPLRDLFIKVLGYSPPNVVGDMSGARGRPDITVFAPGTLAEGPRVAWIVLKAKDEHDACKTPAKRAALFAEKSKYITADTAWFLMVDPTTLVARPADRGTDPGTDIVLDLAALTHDDFLIRMADLRAEVAGVPHLLARFRAGEEGLIATDVDLREHRLIPRGPRREEAFPLGPISVVAYLAQGAWDVAHHRHVQTAVPRWYLPFCAAFDCVFAAGLIAEWLLDA